MELAIRIDQHSTLLGDLCTGVEAHGVVAEIIKHLKSKEETGRMNVCVPIKDRPVDNLDAVTVALGIECVQQVFRLQICECRRDLDDLVLGTLVHLVVCIADEIQNVQHHRSVSSAHLVDYQVVVWIQRKLVI